MDIKNRVDKKFKNQGELMFAYLEMENGRSTKTC
jgi:hypothetical protein